MWENFRLPADAILHCKRCTHRCTAAPLNA